MLEIYHMPDSSLLFFITCHVKTTNRELKKTTTTASCTTPPNNSVNDQNNETARAKYNLVSFPPSSTKQRRQMSSFVENAIVRRQILFEEFGDRIE